MCIWPSETLSLLFSNTSLVAFPLPRLNFDLCLSLCFSRSAQSQYFIVPVSLFVSSPSRFSLVSFIFHLIFPLSLLSCYNFHNVSSSDLSCHFSLFSSLPSSLHRLPSSFIALTQSDNSTCVRLPFAPPSW